MQPCFQVAVKIATVVAARPRGGSRAGRLASMAGVGVDSRLASLGVT